MTKELTYPGPVARGSRGNKARRVQEWLCLTGTGVAVDGAYGPASALALADFQRRKALAETGALDEATWQALVAGLATAAAPASDAGGLRRQMTVLARRHLRQHPREIGGANCGPWVRHYMGGRQGPQFPWCAGFVCTVLRQACAGTGRELPIKPSVGCDQLAASAKAKGRFVAGADMAGKVAAGDIFLVLGSPGDWTHTGIVTRVGDGTVLTIEGNTNDSGDREGYEVCRRVRSTRKLDFITLG